MGSDQSKFFSIFRREVRRTVQKLEEVLSESRSVCPDLSVSSWFPLSLKIVSQWEAGQYGVECLVKIWNFIVTLGSRLSLCCVSGADSTDIKVVDIKSMRFPLLEARSWQEAKSNLVTVALGKDDRIARCWTLGPPV
ncbi:hypothetical protein YC2023_072238 [Brassica napus]